MADLNEKYSKYSPVDMYEGIIDEIDSIMNFNPESTEEYAPIKRAIVDMYDKSNSEESMGKIYEYLEGNNEYLANQLKKGRLSVGRNKRFTKYLEGDKYNEYDPQEFYSALDKHYEGGIDEHKENKGLQEGLYQHRKHISNLYDENDPKGSLAKIMLYIDRNDGDFYDFLNSDKFKLNKMENKEDPKVKEGTGEETKLPSDSTAKPNKVVLRERISSIYPDDSFDEDAEDEKLSGRILEIMDNNDAKTKREKEVLSKLGEDPKMSLMLGALMDGMSFEEAASRFFDLENLPKEGEEGFEAIQKARNERIAEAQKNKEWQDAFKTNMDKSEIAIDEFAKEKGWDKNQVNEFLNKATDELFTKVSQGIIDKDILEKLEKLYNYDEDVESARVAGEVAGRNQTIETKMKKMEGDGLPEGPIGGAEAKQETKKKAYNPFLVS